MCKNNLGGCKATSMYLNRETQFIVIYFRINLLSYFLSHSKSMIIYRYICKENTNKQRLIIDLAVAPLQES